MEAASNVCQVTTVAIADPRFELEVWVLSADV